MEFQHELVIPDEGLPFKFFLFEGSQGNYVREKHWHTSIEIFAVMEGSLTFYLNDEKHPLKAGELMIINSNEVHSIDSPEENHTAVLQIPLKQFEDYFTAHRFIRFAANEQETDSQLWRLIREMYKLSLIHIYTVKEIEAMRPEALIISPGPGKPSDAGICIEAIRYFVGRLPILGICLGHQAICEAFGGEVSYAKELMHGKKKTIYTVGKSRIFEGLGDSFQAARYHSLAALKDKLPDVLKVTAEAEDGEIMAVEHTEYPIYGVQFHPESVMTPDGKKMIENFINVVRA